MRQPDNLPAFCRCPRRRSSAHEERHECASSRRSGLRSALSQIGPFCLAHWDGHASLTEMPWPGRRPNTKLRGGQGAVGKTAYSVAWCLDDALLRARRVRSARRRQPLLSRMRSRWVRTVRHADEQLLRDLGVGPALGDEGDELALARAEVHAVPVPRRRRRLRRALSCRQNRELRGRGERHGGATVRGGASRAFSQCVLGFPPRRLAAMPAWSVSASPAISF